MKLRFAFYLVCLTLFLTSCAEEGLFQGNQISYAEALEMQSLQFSVKGRDIEERNDIGYRSYRAFLCEDLAGECEDNEMVYFQTFSVILDERTEDRLYFQIEPGVMVDSGLLNTSNLIPYYALLTEPIPFFRDSKDLKKHYLKEGDWIKKNNRNVRVFLGMGESYSEFYGSYILQSQDQFEVTEVTRIEDRDHTFLFTGIFQATIPDERFGIPENERLEPVQITEGKFSFIVEPKK